VIKAIRVLRQATTATLRNVGEGFGLLAPWIVIWLLTCIVLLALLFEAGVSQAAAVFALFAIIAPVLIGLSSVAVSWMRFALLGETTEGWQRLRVDGRVWLYLWRALVCAVVQMMVYVALARYSGLMKLQDHAFDGVGNFFSALVLDAMITTASLTVLLRFALALPAAAIGMKEIGLIGSWKLTEKSALQIAGVAFGVWLISLPMEITNELFSSYGGAALPAWLLLLIGLFLVVGLLLLGLFELALQAILFRILVMDKGTPEPLG
jgi:hypothetical protein